MASVSYRLKPLAKEGFLLSMLHETDPEVRHAYAESIAALRERAALGGQGGRVKLVDICPLR